nr:MAG TPA: hypothetical protein [Caudoviricetes sp.]
MAEEMKSWTWFQNGLCVIQRNSPYRRDAGMGF